MDVCPQMCGVPLVPLDHRVVTYHVLWVTTRFASATQQDPRFGCTSILVAPGHTAKRCRRHRSTSERETGHPSTTHLLAATYPALDIDPSTARLQDINVEAPKRSVCLDP
jgi:hypothetical protein